MLKESFFNKLNHLFDQLNFQISKPKNYHKLLVAVSGGSDSLALTLLLQEFCKKHHLELIAVTIDHKMRKESSSEAKRLQKKLSKLGINHQILTSNITKPTSNIEANLRQMRYDLLHQFCRQNNIKLVFLGHQLNDLAENFLIRLFRGSGIDGLAAISEITDFKNIKLIRPLLDFSKDELEQYLTKRKVTWFNDSSNQDEKFLRNKIRKFISSLPNHHLINQRVKAATLQIDESKKIIDDLIIEKAKEMLEFKPYGYFLLNYKKLASCNKNLGLKILAMVLIEISGDIYKPRLAKLENFYHSITNQKLKNHHKAKSFYGCISEKYDDDHLIIYREKQAIDLKNITPFDSNNFLVDGRLLFFNQEMDLAKDQSPFSLLNATKLNILLKKYKKTSIKNPLKKVFYTIPFFNQKYILDEDSMPKFYFRTILKRIFNENSN